MAKGPRASEALRHLDMAGLSARIITLLWSLVAHWEVEFDGVLASFC